MKRMSLTLIAPALALTACQQQPAEPVAGNEMGTMTGSNSMTGPVDPGAATDAAGYIAKAGAGDLFEIESSQVALDKSKNQKVREFAQMMIDQHRKSTARVKAAAGEAGLAVPPPQLMPDQKMMLEEIKAADADAFDDIYLKHQKTAHDAALALHEGYAESGDTPALRQAAAEIAQVVRQHIAHLADMPAS
jgi:putative membrane protein